MYNIYIYIYIYICTPKKETDKQNHDTANFSQRFHLAFGPEKKKQPESAGPHKLHLKWHNPCGQWIGLREKITGNHGFYHEIWGFPVKFPLNQSIDMDPNTVWEVLRRYLTLRIIVNYVILYPKHFLRRYLDPMGITLSRFFAVFPWDMSCWRSLGKFNVTPKWRNECENPWFMSFYDLTFAHSPSISRFIR